MSKPSTKVQITCKILLGRSNLTKDFRQTAERLVDLAIQKTLQLRL